MVAEEQDMVLGTVVLLIVPNLAHRACPWAIVENLIVDFGFQRRQVGKLLMEYAIAQAREAGCSKIMLTSNKSRGGAHQFYRSLGFEASAEGFSLYF
ncbi:GNAT family N-acetyltransferase [Chloroflexota bacterium]